jgi:PAS domain S-box-containing protein
MRNRIVRFAGAYFVFSGLVVVSVMAGAAWLAYRDVEKGFEGPLALTLGSYASTLEGGTINSRGMGGAILFGEENPDGRLTAAGKLPPNNARIRAGLDRLRTLYLGDVALLANRQGTVVGYSSADHVHGTGSNLAFRPYIRRALAGTPNVYPAVGVISPERGIFLSAPVRASATSPPIGAVAIRVGADKLDMLLKTWTGGIALLISPQGVVFASNRDDWRYQSVTALDAPRLDAIRRTRQFGNVFDQVAPGVLPFSPDMQETSLGGVRYAIRSLALEWGDPNGDWRLTFLQPRPGWWSYARVPGLAGAAGLATSLLLSWYFSLSRNAYVLDRMNARLRESDESLRDAQSIAGVGSYRLNIAAGTWEGSAVLDRIFGIDAAFPRSTEGWTRLVHPGDRAMMRDCLQEIADGRRPGFDREYRIVTPADGRVRWVHGLGRVDSDAQGKPVGMHGTIQDISARKEAEEELNDSMRKLEQKELAKTRFLAAAGHDLRQPLAAANLFIDALKFSQPTPHQDKIIRSLEQAMVTFNGLLDTLLNISKLDAGVIRPEQAPIAATELMNWLEQNFAPIAAEKRIAFKLYFSLKDPLVVHSDIGLVRSVLMNLVSNSIKFTFEGGVLVSMRRRDGEALVQVWDTGVGIKPEHLQHIFDEFYQVDNPQRDRTRGLGLGLSIAQRAMSLLGGAITCRSRIGHGSVFAFRLPLASAADARGGPESQHRGTTPEGTLPDASFAAGKCFVVVEDDVLVAQGVVNWLEGMGGRVACFHSGEDALRHARMADADYYIVDYMLSGALDGVQFLTTLAGEKRRPVKAVLVTGDTSPAFFRDAAGLPWPVLHKPVAMSRLVACLSEQGA